MYKICIKCGFEKAISEFRLFKTKYKSYYRGECIVCEKIYADENKEKYKIKRDKNKDKIKQQVEKSKQDFPGENIYILQKADVQTQIMILITVMVKKVLNLKYQIMMENICGIEIMEI